MGAGGWLVWDTWALFGMIDSYQIPNDGKLQLKLKGIEAGG